MGQGILLAGQEAAPSAPKTASMGAIAEKRLGDFVPTIDAYRPVALTVAAILGLVMLLPGAERDPVADLFASSAGTDGELATGAPLTDGPDAGDAGDAGEAAVDAPSGGIATPPGSTPSAITSPSSSSTVGVRSSPRPSSVAASGDGSPAPPPVAPVGPPSDDADEPLRILESGWASSTGGSPIPAEAEGVPEGTLPVGNRLGQTDKVAFVRLSGDGAALVLGEDAAGRRGGEFEAPPVQLCQITDGEWEPGEAQAMADAPEHDPESCVPAQQRPDGTWAFTLAAFADPADARGFALVPTPEAPLDFQVTFASQALAG